MKAAVVDASVAAKWVIQEPCSAEAASLLECETLHAPSHWRAEAVNVLWAKVFRGELTASDAEERMVVLMRAPVVDVPISDLMPRALAISIAHSITIYHSLYVALAERRDIPLVTADERLIRSMTADAALGWRLVRVGDM